MDTDAPPNAHEELFDRERDGERLREVETLLAAVEAELNEQDPPPDPPRLPNL